MRNLDNVFPPGMAGDAIDHEPARRLWGWVEARDLLEDLPGWEKVPISDQGKLIVGVADWILGAKKPPSGS